VILISVIYKLINAYIYPVTVLIMRKKDNRMNKEGESEEEKKEREEDKNEQKQKEKKKGLFKEKKKD
jgi:phosphotransferase system  glucose/maltose/N-acetylglucosamine-specific IIC component